MQFTTHTVIDGPRTFGMQIQLTPKRLVTTMHSSELAKAAD
jgi:hypothetical protein